MAEWSFLLIAAAAALAILYIAFLSFGRNGFVISLVLTLGFIAFLQFDILGRPKPITVEWRSPDSLNVLWSGNAEDGVVAVFRTPQGPRCYFYQGSEAKRQFRKAGVDNEGNDYRLNKPFSETETYDFEGLERELPEK